MNKKIRLLYITNGITASAGLERVLSIKASKLAEDFSYEVHILSLNEAGKSPFYDFSDNIIFHSINVKGNPVSYIYSYVSGIRKTVKLVNPDIISVCDNGLKAFFLPKIILKYRCVIYERHNSKSVNFKNEDFVTKIKRFLVFKAMNYLSNNFDKFVVLTDGHRKEWIKNQNVEVIGNPNSFKSTHMNELRNKKLISVGRQAYQKGYDLLIKSSEQIFNIHPDWELHIYGRKDEKLNLNKQVESLGLSENVFFHEPVKNIEEKYLESYIYVMSSRFEGFGMVLIEAMECGLPCVSFDCPHGPADIITDAYNGFLVENGNHEALAEKIITLIENFELRSKMGVNAKESVKKFDADKIVKQWDNLFKSLIE